MKPKNQPSQIIIYLA